MPDLGHKWMIEMQSDGESEAFRILETLGDKATLKYIAMDEDAAIDLVCALNWFDTFRSGVIASAAAPIKKKAPRKQKPKHLFLQLDTDTEKKPKS